MTVFETESEAISFSMVSAVVANTDVVSVLAELAEVSRCKSECLF